ncbi:MAG: MBL fold metallo-hydrolase [Rickettsiales bacterium]|nr:MBL fold metallo-hydrolase [Rickettsiales bacterium]
MSFLFFVKIKILGSGPSVGVPMMLNYWKNRNIDKSEPKNHRMRSSFYMQEGNKKLLVECGPDFRQQTIKFNITDFNDIFLSHCHQDHIGGIWELENAFKHLEKKINVWCNKETFEGLKQRFSWMFNGDESQYAFFNIIEPFKTYNDLFILEAEHGTLQSIGFKYKNFVFTPDLNVLPDESKKYIKNADLWILQCNNLNVTDYVKSWHTDLKMAIGLIEELQPKRAVLTHLMDEIDYNEVGKILPNNVELAYDGMEIEN